VDIKEDHKPCTFPIPKTLLPLARCVLFKEYIEKRNNDGDNNSWTDYANNPWRETTVPDELFDFDSIPTRLPDSIYKSIIRVNKQGKKMVVITLFCSTGNFQVQGKGCPDWREDELKRVVGCLNLMAKHMDKCSLTTYCPRKSSIFLDGSDLASALPAGVKTRRQSARLLALTRDAHDAIADKPTTSQVCRVTEITEITGGEQSQLSVDVPTQPPTADQPSASPRETAHPSQPSQPGGCDARSPLSSPNRVSQRSPSPAAATDTQDDDAQWVDEGSSVIDDPPRVTTLNRKAKQKLDKSLTRKVVGARRRTPRPRPTRHEHA
jgi:hypothetical protein